MKAVKTESEFMKAATWLELAMAMRLTARPMDEKTAIFLVPMLSMMLPAKGSNILLVRVPIIYAELS